MELCKINSYDRDKLEELLSSCPDKAYVLGQLMYHRMGAAAWYVLKESGLAGKVNREFRNSLRMVYDSSGKRSSGACSPRQPVSWRGRRSPMPC